MSAYQRQDTKFTDSQCLVKALADAGYTEVEVHEQPQSLIDYVGKVRPQKANIIVRRKFVGQSANDIGFVKNSAGFYEAIISSFDLSKHNAVWMLGVKKSYAEHGLIKQSARMGLVYMGKKINAAGKPQLQFAASK